MTLLTDFGLEIPMAEGENTLQEEYNLTETNPNYDYSMGNLMKEYSKTAPKGVGTGFTYLGDIPYLAEGLLRGGADLVTGTWQDRDEWFPSFDKDANWLTQPYGSNAINKSIETGGLLAPSQYQVDYFPDPASMQNAFAWGGLGAFNPTSIPKSLKGVSSWISPTTAGTGFGFGLTSEMVKEGFVPEDSNWGLAVDTTALIGNMVMDFFIFRNKKGFIEKMMKETMGNIDNVKIEKQFQIIKQRIDLAKSNGLPIPSARELFKEFPEMQQLFRVLSQMDGGITNRRAMESGDELLKAMLKVDNLDDLPSILPTMEEYQKSFAEFNTNLNKAFRNDIADIKDLKIMDNLGEQGNLLTLTNQTIDNLRDTISKGSRSPQDNQILSHFLKQVEEVMAGNPTINSLDNVIQTMERQLDQYMQKGFVGADGNIIKLDQGVPKVIRGFMKDLQDGISDNFQVYADATENMANAKKLVIDPLQKGNLMSLLQYDNNPQKVIQAIDELMSSPIYVADDLEPIIKALQKIKGDGAIDDIMKIHTHHIIKSSLKNSDNALNNVKNIEKNLTNSKQQRDRLETLIKIDYKLKNKGKEIPVDQLNKIYDGLLAWTDTVALYTKTGNESATALIQAFQRNASRYGIDPRSIVNVSEWDARTREAFAKFNAEKLAKFLENPNNIEEIIRLGTEGLTPQFINFAYHTSARPYGSFGAEYMPYGFDYTKTDEFLIKSKDDAISSFLDSKGIK